MENTFNFNELTSISRKITRGVSAMAPLSKTVNKKTGKILFRFSQASFKELGLDANSLSAKVTKDGKQVFLAVHPGNTGDFFKSRGAKVKGNAAEHNELSQFLTKAGITGNAFSLNKVGVNDGIDYYRIEDLPNSDEAGESPAPKKRAAKTASTEA